MMRSRWFRFVCRAVPPGFAWIALALAAGCSSGPAVTPPRAPKAGTTAAKPAHPQTPAQDPLPLDPYAATVVPRWLVPDSPQPQPTYTPHWYTRSVDPLFRKRLPTAAEAAEPPANEPDAATPPAQDEAPAPRTRRPAPPDGDVKDYDAVAPLLEGVASWYGPGFHGKPTASGETYDQNRLTAAHPTLPLGTIIRVQNELNGRVVWVRVNDRGPYKKGRVLDLSRAAAERLGMVDEGTARVRISVLRWPRSTDTDLGLRAYSQYVVQVAAYPEPDKAEDVLERMQRRFDWAEFMLDPRPSGALAVVAGPYEDQDAAQRVAKRLHRSGVSSLVRRYRK
jgi:peptidoglycan lytic transglycosylase